MTDRRLTDEELAFLADTGAHYASLAAQELIARRAADPVSVAVYGQDDGTIHRVYLTDADRDALNFASANLAHQLYEVSAKYRSFNPLLPAAIALLDRLGGKP